MPNASARSALGIVKEASFGVGGAPTNFLPVKTITPKDVLTLLEDKGLRQSMVDAYDAQAGPIHATLDFDGDLYADIAGFLLAGILGDVTDTGASAPYTHTFAALNSGTGQPPSYALTDYYAANTRAYAGAKFSDVGFKIGADTLVTYTAKAVTLASAVASSPPAPSYSALAPIPGWVGKIQLNGANFGEVLDAEVNIKRTVTPLKAVDNTQAPFQLWSGPISVDGKFTVVMEDDTQLTNYLTVAKPTLDITFTQGAGAALTSFELHMSKVIYQAADITRGKDYVELPVTFKAYGNSTDVGASSGYSNIKATLQNAIAAGVYK